MQERIQDISLEYNTYKGAGTVLDYLRTLGHNVNILRFMCQLEIKWKI